MAGGVSLSTIARNLGLSVTTVSRALGGFSDVAAATRARVQQEAARIGYRPNQAARRLRSGRSEAVGVVLPAGPGQFDDPFFLRLLSAIGPPLQAAGLDLLVATARPGADEMRAYRHLVEGRRVDGILLARMRRQDERIAYLLDCGMPFVAHGRSEETRPFAHVDIDGEGACRDATARLIGLGHRRIGMINGLDTYMFAVHREAGWRAALFAVGLAPGPVVQAEPTEENGFRLMGAMLRATSSPTAVLCATDRLAVGALHAIGHAGLRAGRDVSVIGYDNLPMATYTDPPLTTIEQPIERAGTRMVEMLRALMAGAPAQDFAEVWPATLIPRHSDGPAPGHDNAAAEAAAANKTTLGGYGDDEGKALRGG
jgi:LacI family transcriptional regulator